MLWTLTTSAISEERTCEPVWIVLTQEVEEQPGAWCFVSAFQLWGPAGWFSSSGSSSVNTTPFSSRCLLRLWEANTGNFTDLCISYSNETSTEAANAAYDHCLNVTQSKSGVSEQQASVPTVFSAVRMRFLSCWKSSSFTQSELRDAWNFSDSREARDCFLPSSSGRSTKTQKQHMQMDVLYTVSKIIFYTGLMKCFKCHKPLWWVLCRCWEAPVAPKHWCWFLRA